MLSFKFSITVVKLFSLLLQVELFADTLVGNMKIETSGGDGNQGQDGSAGEKGDDYTLSKV